MLSMKTRSGSFCGVIIDAKDRYSVFSRDVRSGHTFNVILKKAYNHSVGKLLIAVSSFGRAFLHVFYTCTCPKMGGIDAFWVVARMENVHSCWNRAVRFFVRKPMSKLLAHVRVYGKHSVSLIVSVGLPLPAAGFGVLGNLGPESFVNHSLTMMGFPSEVKR